MKYIKHLFVALIGVVGLSVLPLSAQKHYIEQVKVADVEVSPLGMSADKAQLQMSIILDDLDIRSNDRLILTPILRDKRTQEIVHLFPQVDVMGRNRYIINQRRQKSEEEQDRASLTSLRRYNDTPQSVPYKHSFLYASYMEHAELLLVEQVYGCADCFILEDAKPLLEDFKVLFEHPKYSVTYIVPPVEPIKAREGKHVATLNFPVDKSNIDAKYGDNRSVLAEVQRVMEEVTEDPNITITKLTVAGFASPEATVAYNKNLSERRAKSFANYLAIRYGLAGNQMVVKAPGEDWEKTRQLVAESNHPDREAILSIIDNTPNFDSRDAKIKELSGGATYRWMLDEIYPHVRRVEYTIAYHVRAFDVQEARKIIKTKPKQLSLNEMYLVANSYEPLSREFKEVFDIAARLYPNEPTAIINASAMDIEGGNFQSAVSRMSRIVDNPSTWNNLGVAYAHLGNIDLAKTYFEKAIANGDEDARANLQELSAVRDK